ncbi:MAG: helix-turn-helix domain-containing protein, partial [Oscillospiraceae bacterium]|nr:helix-turn-helix domain-containing protein [Oscillospiraceae bacterium]
MVKTEFANNIHELRRRKGISQRAAAQELGISQALLSHYENGVREPRLPFVRRLASYFGVSVDYILSQETARGCQLSEQAQDMISRMLDSALASGGEPLATAAARYVLAAAANLRAILENPDSPYNPGLSIDIRTAEA